MIGGLSQVDRRPLLAGLLLGLATMKPQLGLLLPVLLLAQRQWRVMAMAVLIALLLIGVSMALDGVAVWRQYFQATLPLQQRFLESPTGFFMLLTVTPFMAGKSLGLPVSMLYGLQLAIGLLCVLGVYRIGRLGPPLLAMVFTLAAAFLATPYAMAYDLVILAGAGLLLLAAPSGWLAQRRRAAVFALLWLLPLWAMALNLFHIAVAPFVIALFAWQVYSDAVKKSKSAPRSACMT